MFNEKNVKGRQLHRVRGLVLVACTSTIVEFVNDKLTQSITLWSHPNLVFMQGESLTFLVELHGFLSFDESAQVKIEEVAPYERAQWSATSFSLVRPADPFVSVYAQEPQYGPNGNDGVSDYIDVLYTVPGGVNFQRWHQNPNYDFSAGFDVYSFRNRFVVGEPYLEEAFAPYYVNAIADL